VDHRADNLRGLPPQLCENCFHRIAKVHTFNAVSYWGWFPGQGLIAPQQFPIDPRELVEGFEHLAVGLDRLAGLGDLSVGFEQQAAPATFGEAAVEVEEGAVFGALMTGALGAPAGQEPFQQGGVNEVGRQLEGPQEVSFALAQSQGGEALDGTLTTPIYL
jgi:hypothetical protein